jgi:ketosteroid isomerase-like protein
MKTLRPLLGLAQVCLGATVVACASLAGQDLGRAAPTEVPAEAAPDVAATDREFAQMALESGTSAAYDRFLADDAVMFRPLPVRAREWLVTHEPATGRLEWAPALAETACDSSLAVTLGTWSYTAQDSKVADTGQYLTVWRRTDAGEWQIVLDQAIDAPSMPAAASPAGGACDQTKPTTRELLAAERDRNSGLHKLGLTDSSDTDVNAVTVGSVTGSASADLAVTYGELLDQPAAHGSEPLVRAVYVRVWQREGRSWRVLHDYATSATP